MNAAEFHSTRQFIPASFGRIASVARGSGPAVLFLRGVSTLLKDLWSGN